MQKTELFKYYRFGFNYFRLWHASEAHSNREFFDGLSGYFKFIDGLKLTVTKSGIRRSKLVEDLEEIQKLAEDLSKSDEKITSLLRYRVIEKLEKIDSILDAELLTRDGYILEDKRYSLNILTEDIGKIFGEGVYEKLPSIAQYDFKECGLCLAFDRYTAAAFHILRGTEDVLKIYYSKLCKAVPKKSSTWGTFITTISKQAKLINPAPPEELLINLDNLRKYYRNTTQHPDKIYTSDEVQDLIGLCVKTVNEIISDLLKRKLLNLDDLEISQ